MEALRFLRMVGDAGLAERARASAVLKLDLKETSTVRQRIEDYALIGDCETAALVGRDGSIDWLCWPRFDSGAVFAALLGDADNGHWTIAPLGQCEDSARRTYRGTR